MSFASDIPSVVGLMYESDAHETFADLFMSPAVLQANETGALVRVRRGTEDFEKHGPYKRTRNVSALGFDPILTHLEFETERARLLEWVARNAPRRRHRTLSNPAAMLDQVREGLHPSYGSVVGSGDEENSGLKHVRSRTIL
jgi:hypothetical protein